MSKNGLIKGIALALAMSFGLSFVQPREAKAYLLVTMALDDYAPLHAVEHNPAATLLCLIFLPTCILDQNASADVTVAQQDLIANGYTLAQANQIVADNHDFLGALSSQHEKFVVTNDDTKESLEQGIRAVLPNASQVFVDYAATQALVNR